MGIRVTVRVKSGETRNVVIGRDDVTIGRVETNDIVVPEGHISALHAKIVLRDGRLIAIDQRTRFGTWVNGQRLTMPRILKAGDEVYVGDAILMFHID